LTLQHVSVEVEPGQVAACVAFYELLGFRPVDPPPSLADRAAWVERAGTQIHLMRRDDPVHLPAGHFAVVVDDYEPTLDRLREAGFDPEPRQEHWGAPRSFVRDPAGNRVELMAAPP
jgi:catechol 2,3-dioxygenase-like lactoylglutathione lyase family enzyme